MAKKTWAGTTDSVYSTAGNWLEGSIPVATNAVWLQGSVAITGEDQSSVAVDELLVELNANMGSNITYMQIDPDSLTVNNTSGVHYLDIGAATIAPIIKSTNKPDSGYGMYLIGSGMTTVTMYGGSLAIAGLLDETATVSTLRINASSTCYLGPGVTFTTLYQEAGTVIQECASTTNTINNGTLTTKGSGAITTMNVYGGTVNLNSTGTITTLNHYGGIVNATGDGFAKTITTYNSFTNGNPILNSDPNIVTITNFNEPTTKFTAAWA